MHAFQDADGRRWSLTIDIDVIRTLRADHGIDLAALVTSRLQGLGELIANPARLINVLWVLLVEQADAVGVSYEAFKRSLLTEDDRDDGDAALAAAWALTEELVDAVMATEPSLAVRRQYRRAIAELRRRWAATPAEGGGR